MLGTGSALHQELRKGFECVAVPPLRTPCQLVSSQLSTASLAGHRGPKKCISLPSRPPAFSKVGGRIRVECAAPINTDGAAREAAGKAAKLWLLELADPTAVAAAQPTIFLSRRRMIKLAAVLLLASVPMPVPVLEPSTLPPARWPRPVWPGRAVAAAAPAGAGTGKPASAHAGAALSEAAAATAAVVEDEVQCYVAPKPLEESGPSPRYFASLSAAVAACPDGGVVLVAAGRYRERLLLTRPLTLRAWPKGALVEVVWETPEPYQSTLDISSPLYGPGAPRIVVEGLTIRHSSKSVANNYGVFIRGGSPLLVNCDISSASGAGVGVEGCSPQVVGCRIHDCARQGVAIFGGSPLDLDLDPALDPEMLYGMTGGVVRDCDVYSNTLDGVLVRSGASPDLLDNLIHNNAGFGVNLQDCSGRYEGNTVYDNTRGSVAASLLFELDAGELAGSNSLRGLLRRL